MCVKEGSKQMYSDEEKDTDNAIKARLKLVHVFQLATVRAK